MTYGYYGDLYLICPNREDTIRLLLAATRMDREEIEYIVYNRIEEIEIE